MSFILEKHVRIIEYWKKNCFLHEYLILEAPNLKSLNFRVPFAYHDIHGSLKEQHRVKFARAIISSVLEENPKKRYGLISKLNLIK